MNDRVCLVTGGTHGIGRATALALAARGAQVLVHGREREQAQAVAAAIVRASGNPRVHGVHADFARLEEVRRLARELTDRLPALHVLINNAAVMDGARRKSAEGYDLTFAVNHLAPFLLTNLLVPRLIASAPARVVVVASEAHRRAALDFSDLMNEGVSGYWPAYERSKLANLLFARELARRLAGSGVTVNALHPGVVASGLFRGAPAPLRVLLATLGRVALLSPRQGARGSVELALAEDLSAASGGYYRRGRRVAPSLAAQSDADARTLWQASARLTGFDR
jgi:NAD(P)-dependent dehydrogenase (short-subunit alcohol dehydrogenase family)